MDLLKLESAPKFFANLSTRGAVAARGPEPVETTSQNGLTAQFDALCAAVIAGAPNVPGELTAPVGVAGWTPLHKALAEDAGRAHDISERMYRDVFERLIRAVNETTLSSDEQPKFQVAIAGSYAALLHAHYPVPNLESVLRILVKLHCEPDCDPGGVLVRARARIVEFLKTEPELGPVPGKLSSSAIWSQLGRLSRKRCSGTQGAQGEAPDLAESGTRNLPEIG